jgi:hypothetical protein
MVAATTSRLRMATPSYVLPAISTEASLFRAYGPVTWGNPQQLGQGIPRLGSARRYFTAWALYQAAIAAKLMAARFLPVTSEQ